MFKNIVIATRTVDGLAAALERATAIEHVTEAEVTVIDVLWEHFTDEPNNVISAADKERLIDHYVAREQRELDRALDPFRSKIETLDALVYWAKRLEDRIADEVASLEADLVIKAITEPSHGLKDWISMPLDWRVMRNLHVPVLFALGEHWQDPKRVLAAVDVTDRHEAVTSRIIDCATRFAEVFDCGIDLVTTFRPIAEHAHPALVSNYDVVRDNMRSSRLRDLEAIAAGISRPTTLHVVEGHAGPTIETLALEIGASVTVIGTAARHGLGKLFLGNTAEEIIAHISGDLVTVSAPG